MQEDKKKILQAEIKKLQSKYGETAVGFLGKMPRANVEAMSTGIPDLDRAIGIGGAPKGRIIEVYGPESAGKTTVALAMVAECQRSGGVAAIIDVEHALDPFRARQLGVNTDELIFSQPDTAEEALDLVTDLALIADIIIIDSVAGLLPQEEEEKDMDKQQVGLQARLMSKALRKQKGILSKNKCTAVYINQIREKVGVMFGEVA